MREREEEWERRDEAGEKLAAQREPVWWEKCWEVFKECRACCGRLSYLIPESL